MARADLKQMTRTPEAKLGHFIVEFATPGIGHILKQAGCDFALFDLEHSGFGFETVKSAMRYFEAAEVSGHRARTLEGISPHRPGLRHGGRRDHDPDGRHRRGSQGRCRLHEIFSGWASVAWPWELRMTPTRQGPVPEKLAAANERTTLFCQIETAEGAENADAIAAVDGVDCLWVGHFDLVSVARHSGPVRSSEISEGDRAHDCGRQEAQESTGPPRAHHRGWASRSTSRASISAAIRAMSGCFAMRWPRQSPPCGRDASNERLIPRCPFGRFQEGGRFGRTIPISIWRRCSRRPASRWPILDNAKPSAQQRPRRLRRADPAGSPVRARKRTEKRQAEHRRPLWRRL